MCQLHPDRSAPSIAHEVLMPTSWVRRWIASMQKVRILPRLWQMYCKPEAQQLALAMTYVDMRTHCRQQLSSMQKVLLSMLLHLS